MKVAQGKPIHISGVFDVSHGEDTQQGMAWGQELELCVFSHAYLHLQNLADSFIQRHEYSASDAWRRAMHRDPTTVRDSKSAFIDRIRSHTKKNAFGYTDARSQFFIAMNTKCVCVIHIIY